MNPNPNLNGVRMLTFLYNEPLHGIPYIFWLTIVIFYAAGVLSSRRFIRKNFLALRSNTDFYEPMFAILLYISLLICFLIDGSLRKQALVKFNTARLIYWSENQDIVNNSLRYFQVDFKELDREILNFPDKFIELYKLIPSSDLVDKMLQGYSVSDRFTTMFEPILAYSNILFLTLLIVFASTAFQFGVNTVGLTIPRFGVILILLLMSLAILFALEFLPVSLNLSDEFSTRQY